MRQTQNLSMSSGFQRLLQSAKLAFMRVAGLFLPGPAKAGATDRAYPQSQGSMPDGNPAPGASSPSEAQKPAGAYTVHTDGSFDPETGMGGIGCALYDPRGKLIACMAQPLSLGAECKNGAAVAECAAGAAGLRLASAAGAEKLLWFTDNKPLAEFAQSQLANPGRPGKPASNGALAGAKRELRAEFSAFSNLVSTWTSRKNNKLADALSKIGSGKLSADSMPGSAQRKPSKNSKPNPPKEECAGFALGSCPAGEPGASAEIYVQGSCVLANIRRGAKSETREIRKIGADREEWALCQAAMEIAAEFRPEPGANVALSDPKAFDLLRNRREHIETRINGCIRFQRRPLSVPAQANDMPAAQPASAQPAAQKAAQSPPATAIADAALATVRPQTEAPSVPAVHIGPNSPERGAPYARIYLQSGKVMAFMRAAFETDGAERFLQEVGNDRPEWALAKSAMDAARLFHAFPGARIALSEPKAIELLRHRASHIEQRINASCSFVFEPEEARCAPNPQF